MLALESTKSALRLENTGPFLFAAVTFRLILEGGYRAFVHPVFEYAGFGLDVDWTKYLESWAIFTILLLVFPKRLRRASDFLMAYLLFSFLTPLLIFFAFNDSPREHLYVVLLGVILVAIFRVGEPFHLPLLKGGRIAAYLLLILGAGFVTFWMFYSGGLSYFNLDFSRVYEFRRDVGSVIDRGVMAYFNTWSTKVFGPVLLSLALWKKKYIAAALVLGLHLIWFGVSSHKAVAFYPFLVIFLWMWFRNSRALAILPVGMSLVVVAAYVFFTVFSEIFVGSLLVRRVFFVPSSLTFAYYDFFSVNQFVYWSNSMTSFFIDYPYDLSPSELIGRYRGTGSGANNSFLATGYMHAGIAGIVIYGILVGLLFRFIDSLAHNGVPAWVAVASIIVPSQSLLASADLPTAILTHGIGMAVVILFLLRSTTDDRVFGMPVALKPG
jgi:hypothetical protein